ALGLAFAAPASPAFHLYFLGHEVGAETDTVVSVTGAQSVSAGGTPNLIAKLHFVDRGTAVDLDAVLTDPAGPPRLTLKGRNYRLFNSVSDVSVRYPPGATPAAPFVPLSAHVRDLAVERDVDIAGRPFFPIDNYAPIGVQEALINYWLAHG